MFKLVVKTVYIFVLLSLFYGETNAQTKLFTGTGLWHDAAKWTPSGVPSSSDIVLIAAGASVTVNSNASCDSIYFQPGATASSITLGNNTKLLVNKGIAYSNPTANVTQAVNVGSAELECKALWMPDLTTGRVNKLTTSTGIVTVNSSLSMLGSASENIIEYIGAGMFRLGGTWNSTGGTFTTGASGFEYFSNDTQSIKNRTYNKLILSGGVKNPTGTITCNDSLIVNTGATLNNSGTASLTMNGVFYIAGTYIEGSTSGSVTLVGLVHIATTGTFQVNVAEIFSIRGGIKNDGTFISGSGTYTFATNNQELSGNKMITFSGGVTVTGITLTASDSVRINGSFTGTGTYVNQTYLLLMGATNSISNLDLSSTGNTVEYGAGVNQTVKGTTYKNLLITGSGTKTANADVYISNSLFIDAGPTLALSTFLLSLDPACLTTGTGNLSTANITSTPIPLGKTWPFTTITYNSASAQTIVNGTYNNLSSSNYARTLSNIDAIIINGLFTPGSGTYTTTGSVVQFNSVGTQTISGVTGGYNKIQLNGGIKNPVGTVVCNDSFIVNAGVTLNNSGSANLRFNGVFYIKGTYIEGSTSGTVTLAGLTHIGSTGTFQATVGEAFTISGGIKNEGTFISGGGTYTFATNSQELSGNKMFVFTGGVTVTGITLTVTDSVQINGSLAGTGTYVNKSYLLLMGTSFAVTNLDLSEQNNTVEYGRTSAQTIRAITYKYLRISGAAVKTAGGTISVQLGLFIDTLSTLSMSTQVLSIEPNCTISGKGNLTTNNLSANPVPSNLVWPFTNFTYGSTSTQTIVAGSYVNLTSSNAARILQNTGIIKISGTFTPGTGTYTRTGSTIEFNGSSNQTIPVFTYNNLTSSNTGARTLASGTITIQGNFNPGSNSYTTTGNTMVFNSASQNLSGTFNNLTLSTAGTKTANGNIDIAGTLNIATGVTLDLTNSYLLTGTISSISNSGNIKTAVPTTLSATPIPSGKTWNGTLEFSGTSQQTLTNGTYHNLIINGGSVKSTSGNVIINGTLTFTSGKLDINNTTLTLGGQIVNTVSQGLKSGGNASLIINGNLSRTLSFDQTTPGTSNKLNSFTNNSSSSTTTIANMMLVDDVITPTSGTINANGNITLLSNATNTARIAQGTGNYITGNVKAQRYIPESARRWRFVSSPVSNATLEDWRGEMYITGPGTGTTIGTTNSNGYDATANNAAGVYWYNETLTSGDLNTGWTVPTNTSHILTTGRGYRLFVRGDRSDINRITNANPNQNAVTIDVTGPVNKGDITMPVTFTSSGNLSNDGWNLIGNPYPSPFNWKTFHETGRSGNSGTNYTNIEPTIWVLDPVENTYKFYNTLSNEGTIADGILSQSQGFWVKATGPGASITFKESFKTNDAPTQLFKSTEGGAFRLKLMRDALNADDLLIKYMSGSTNNFDAYDVVKLSSPILVSAWGSDSVHLALSTRPLTTQNDTIKLYVSGSSGTYTMQFTNSDKIAIQDQVLLFDTYSNNVVDLKQNSNYTFNINTSTPATFGFNRFYIVVANNNQLPVKLLTFNGKKENNNQVKLSWTTAIERNSSRFEVEHATDNKTFKPVGVVNAKGNSNVLTQYTFTHNSASTINYYRLKQIDVDNSFDYSKVVMINFNESEEIMIEPVKIYPIPAKDEITVELNKSQNITAISIYKLDGVIVNSFQTNSPKVKLEISDLPQGVYVLQIEDEFGEIFKHKLIKE